MRITSLILLLAIAATACRAESVTRVRVDSDGSTSLVSEFAFDDEALELIGEEGSTPAEVLDLLAETVDPAALPVARPGAFPVQFERGDLKGLRVTFDDMGPAEINEQVSGGTSLIERLDLTVSDGRLVVDGVTRIATPAELERLREAAPGDISEVLAITFVLEVAGSISSHNAGRVEGGRYEWDLLPAVTDQRAVSIQLTAEVGPGFELAEDEVASPRDESDEEEPGTSYVAVLLGVAVIGGFGLVLTRRLLRR